MTADARGVLLGRAIEDAWPQYGAYALSFVVIGIWWVNHHIYLSVVDRVDRLFLFGNIAMLVFIAFIPYPTSLIAEHYHDDGLTAATTLYTLTLAGAALCTDIFWFHAIRGRRLVAKHVDPERAKKLTRQIISGAPLSIAGALIALWNPRATLVLIAVAIGYYVVGGETTASHVDEVHSAT